MAAVPPSVESTVEATVEPRVEATADATVEPRVEPRVEPTLEPTAEPAALLQDDDWREWMCAQAVARFATLNRHGAPHLVPVVFVLHDAALWLPVDGKPKRTANLARLDNLRRDRRCAMLFDLYSADWQALRWLRLDGAGEVVALTDTLAATLTAAFGRKYPQYGVIAPLTAPPTAIRFTWRSASRWRAGVA